LSRWGRFTRNKRALLQRSTALWSAARRGGWRRFICTLYAQNNRQNIDEAGLDSEIRKSHRVVDRVEAIGDSNIEEAAY
jgi:hypothetical protein